MTITAKYSSKCATCGGAIRVGEKIEWSKGSPARHAAEGMCQDRQTTPTPAAKKPASTGRASQKQINYALSLIDRMDEPLIGDAFSPPSAAQVERMGSREVSALIGMLLDDRGDY